MVLFVFQFVPVCVFVTFHVAVYCPYGLFVGSQCDVYTMQADVAADSQSSHSVYMYAFSVFYLENLLKSGAL